MVAIGGHWGSESRAREREGAGEIADGEAEGKGGLGFGEKFGLPGEDATNVATLIRDIAFVGQVDLAVVGLARGLGGSLPPGVRRRKNAPGAQEGLVGECDEEVIMFGGDGGVMENGEWDGHVGLWMGCWGKKCAMGGAGLMACDPPAR